MQQALGSAAQVPVLSVSELNYRLRMSLERGVGEVWVGGEISNLKVATSGHLYFCLKDRRCQIQAVMFRSASQTLPFRPRDGLDVIVRGRASVYDVRGDLQLYVEAMEPRGLGSLQLALEQLKQRLAAEGLFATERKRPLPAWPRAVGIATAPTGAAIHDMVATMRSRMPHVRVILRPVRVQGRGAGGDVAAALLDLNAVPTVDVIIVGRGGGSLEDLWAFNEERVVRAVSTSRAPVVSAVGHETDITLTDLVADRRAATPTAAAALVVPDCADLAQHLARLRGRLHRAVYREVQQQRGRLGQLTPRVRHPRQLLMAQRVHLDALVERARRAVDGTVGTARLRAHASAARLDALSPLAVLRRGYAIAQRLDTAAVVRSVDELADDDALKLVLGHGWARVQVRERGS